MAMIFHKTKLQQELSKSLSHAECRGSKQSEFGTPKKSNRPDAWVAMSCRSTHRAKREESKNGACAERWIVRKESGVREREGSEEE